MSSSNQECGVCCEQFNKSTRKAIVCQCEYTACTGCTTRYIVNGINLNAHCMSCKAEWDRDFMASHFTKTFVNKEYKQHREKVLFDRERSMLPATQPLAEMMSHVRTLLVATVAEIAKVEKELIAAQAEHDEYSIKHRPTRNYYAMNNVVARVQFEDDIFTYKANIVVLSAKLSDMQKRKTFLQSYMDDPTYVIDEKEKAQERREFIRACPAQDCRGFLSTAWKCGMCLVNVCADCHEIKNDTDHVCNPDSLKTVALLSKDTRSCPKCATQIFKINGCAQIWCTQCHTAFDFNTGKIETHVHNPHYYEYLRQQGTDIPRAPGDVPGGGGCDHNAIMTAGALSRKLQAFTSNNIAVSTKIMEYLRMHSHIMYTEIGRYVVNDRGGNQDLRIKYLLNDINEDRFRQLVQQREKKNEKKREIHQIITMYQTVTMDVLAKIMACQDTAFDKLQEMHDELQTLRNYFNKCMRHISRRDNTVVPQICDSTLKNSVRMTFIQAGRCSTQ